MATPTSSWNLLRNVIEASHGHTHCLTSSKSLSSNWTSKLLSWRNEDSNIVRKISTELTLPLLTLTSIIETAVYKVLSYLNTKNNYKCLLHSAQFTVKWTAQMLKHNITSDLVCHTESRARAFLKR